MNERQDIDMLAAEYALGTLDFAERRSVESRRSSESKLDAAITAWESRLDPLNGYTAAVEPSKTLFEKIEARLADSTPSKAFYGTDRLAVFQLQRSVARWRTSAAVAAALAACLATLLLLRETLLPRQPTNFVAVFNENDARPAFVLSIDLDSREVIIRPIAAERQPGKTYQLWILAKTLGPAPRSLGLLDAPLQPTRRRLADFEPVVLRYATFGISLEPEGGSPTGQPTGPALHGRLIPAAP